MAGYRGCGRRVAAVVPAGAGADSAYRRRRRPVVRSAWSPEATGLGSGAGACRRARQALAACRRVVRRGCRDAVAWPDAATRTRRRPRRPRRERNAASPSGAPAALRVLGSRAARPSSAPSAAAPALERLLSRSLPPAPPAPGSGSRLDEASRSCAMKPRDERAPRQMLRNRRLPARWTWRGASFSCCATVVDRTGPMPRARAAGSRAAPSRPARSRCLPSWRPMAARSLAKLPSAMALASAESG